MGLEKRVRVSCRACRCAGVCVCMREGFIRSFVMFLIIVLGAFVPPKQAPAGRVYFFLLSLSIEFYGLESVTGHSIRGGGDR